MITSHQTGNRRKRSAQGSRAALIDSSFCSHSSSTLCKVRNWMWQKSKALPEWRKSVVGVTAQLQYNTKGDWWMCPVQANQSKLTGLFDFKPYSSAGAKCFSFVWGMSRGCKLWGRVPITICQTKISNLKVRIFSKWRANFFSTSKSR